MCGVSNSWNNRVVKFDSSGNFLQRDTARPAMKMPTGTGLDYVSDVAVDSSGNVWVVDSGANHVVKYDASGTRLSELGQLRAQCDRGWVITFTEDAAFALADRAGEALSRLRVLAAHPIIPIADDNERARISALCTELFEELSLAREGYRMSMRGLLALIAVGVARLAASRARTGSVTLQPADATVARLRALVDEYFRSKHQLGFYAEKLGMTVDRLNDHVKRATGVTAGHLIRQRLLTEAKRQLVFTAQPIQNIAQELAFSDPSHFARFFRKNTGSTPHEFRDRRG